MIEAQFPHWCGSSWCFPSEIRMTQSPLMLTMLLLFFFCQSQNYSHTESCPIKSYRKKQVAFVPLLCGRADVSEAGSHGWLGATKGLGQLTLSCFSNVIQPCSSVSFCVCVCGALSLSKCNSGMALPFVSAGRQKGKGVGNTETERATKKDVIWVHLKWESREDTKVEPELMSPTTNWKGSCKITRCQTQSVVQAWGSVCKSLSVADVHPICWCHIGQDKWKKCQYLYIIKKS